jgi:hypothetical protein
MKWLLLALLNIGLPLLLAELTEVAPWLAARMLRAAAQVLPARHRERYEEEWLAELDAKPGKLLRLVFAARIALRAPAIRRELQQADPVWVRLGRWSLAALIAAVVAAGRLASRWGRKVQPPTLRFRLPPRSSVQSKVADGPTGELLTEPARLLINPFDGLNWNEEEDVDYQFNLISEGGSGWM